MNVVLAKFPEFGESWAKHKSFWGDEEAGLGNDVTAFSHYAKTLIEKNDPSVKPVFEFVEECLQSGNEQVKNTFKTSFLENIMNYGDQIDLVKIAPILGTESRLFCKAWNDYTGVDVPGI